MPLPDAMQRHSAPVSPEKVIEDFERQAEIGAWDGIQDAFEPVRQLIQGPTGLVSPDVYEHYRHISARVLSRVSVVRSKAPWAFFCLTGGAFGAPRWILLPSFKGAPITELGNVCGALRERLTDEADNLPFDERSASVLTEFINRLDEAERSLLPRRKQRALEEMRIVVEKLAEAAGATSKQQDVDHLVNIMEMLDRNLPSYQPDWDEVAGRWLDVIRPVWFEMLTQRKRARPLLLKDIRNELLARGPWLTDQILHRFREFPVLPGPEERVKACIVGVS
jgi:hypothetical protein